MRSLDSIFPSVPSVSYTLLNVCIVLREPTLVYVCYFCCSKFYYHTFNMYAVRSSKKNVLFPFAIRRLYLRQPEMWFLKKKKLESHLFQRSPTSKNRSSLPKKIIKRNIHIQLESSVLKRIPVLPCC